MNLIISHRSHESHKGRIALLAAAFRMVSTSVSKCDFAFYVKRVKQKFFFEETPLATLFYKENNT